MTPRHLLAISLCGLGLSMPAAAADTVIAHVTLIDGTGGPAIQDAWVHLADDRVSAIGTGAPPKRGDEIDGTGKFLIPGLIDSHVHIGGGRIRAEIGGAADEIAARRAAAVPSLHGYLYSGVTSVYDSGNFEDFIFPMRDAERAGEIVSPRIFATGGVVAFPRGYGSGPGATLIGSEEDFDALDRHLDWQPDMVKFIIDPQGRRGIPESPIFTPELLKQAIARVHARGIRTTVHIPTEVEARMAIEAGIDALAHPAARTDTSAEFPAYIVEKRIPVSTTLTVFSNIAKVADNPGMFDTPLYRATLPEEERNRQKTTERERYIDSGMSAFFTRMLPGMQRNIKASHDNGITLALGTDRSFGPTVHQELELIVESGISPVEAIRMATLNGAIYLGMENDLGSIEVGKLADLVMLSADPTEDVTNAQSVVAVFKGGQEIDLSKLDLPVNAH